MMETDNTQANEELDRALYGMKYPKDLLNFVRSDLPHNLDDSGDEMMKLLTIGFDKLLLKNTNISAERVDQLCDSLAQLLHVKADSGDSDHQPILIGIQLLYQCIKRETPNLHDLKPVVRNLVPLLYTKELGKIVHVNAIVCLQLYAQKSDDKELMQQLWQKISSEPQLSDISLQVLVHLIDDFMRLTDDVLGSALFKDTITSLLNCQAPLERKTGYYLLRKYVDLQCQMKPDDQALRTQWTTYITIIEELEENQPHLILPSLQLLKSLPRTGDAFWLTLMQLLHKKMLSHNNSQINQWAVDYFLQRFTCEDFETPESLLDVLNCLNNTRLYNYEGHFLCTDNARNFLNGNLTGFIEEMSNVNWKSVPLHFWLKQLERCRERIPIIGTPTILQLASRVRNIQRISIRDFTRRLFVIVFKNTIRQMGFTDYCLLIEALYNVFDTYDNMEEFIQKASASPEVDGSVLTGRLFEIVSNKCYPHEDNNAKRVWDVYDETKWCCTFKLYTRMSFLLYLYDTKVAELSPNATLSEVVALFRKELGHLDISDWQLHDKAVEYYVKWFWKSENSDVTLNDLISMSSPAAFWQILYALPRDYAMSQSDLDTCLKHLPELLTKHKHNIHMCKIVDRLFHISSKMPMDVRRVYVEKLYNITKHAPISNLESEIPDDILTANFRDCFVIGEIERGDRRIEKIYDLRMRDCLCADYVKRIAIATQTSPKMAEKVLPLDDNLSKEKPRYFENSITHLMKLRIARTVYQAVVEKQFTSEALWLRILEHNNQPNITYVYEICIAFPKSNWNSIMQRAREIAKYTASVQISLISILHLHFTVHTNRPSATLTDADFNEVINILLPLTMGANFQVRLFAQLALYNILCCLPVEFESWTTDNPSTNVVKMSLENTIGKERIKYLIDNEVRLQLHARCLLDFTNQHIRNDSSFYWKDFSKFDLIAYMTNVPIDEYKWVQPYLSKFKHFRRMYENRHNIGKEFDNNVPTTRPKLEDYPNVQRKINPRQELLHQSSLISYPECEADNAIFVVASLIDKLPNLGGIARTCEVFGIKNLVLSSKAYTRRDEFKNLSMSAENMLNIIEVKASALVDFLMQKRLEGYKIVGAEQTVNSESFVNFEFPEKCVLLLGHEKEGLPPNLIGFLDYAIEIPQFGMVRSLNVHVTAALFMWEYCKQHIVYANK